MSPDQLNRFPSKSKAPSSLLPNLLPDTTTSPSREALTAPFHRQFILSRVLTASVLPFCSAECTAVELTSIDPSSNVRPQPKIAVLDPKRPVEVHRSDPGQTPSLNLHDLTIYDLRLCDEPSSIYSIVHHHLTRSLFAMLISSLCFLALASLGTFATPLALPHPEPIPTSPSGLRRSVPLSHTPSHIERARHAHASRQNAKVDRRWSYPVERHEVQERNVDPTWLLREAAKVDTRYNDGSGGFGKLLANEQRKRKRGNGEVSLTDHNLDASYSASMSVGTPAQSFGIILDTGSSDLWFASSNCNSGCDGMTEFNLGQSSSFVK